MTFLKIYSDEERKFPIGTYVRHKHTKSIGRIISHYTTWSDFLLFQLEDSMMWPYYAELATKEEALKARLLK